MLDIETMGTGPDAAMIQLSAVYFNADTLIPYESAMGKEFDAYLDLQQVKDLGFKVDKSTEDWWSQQNKKVLKDILAKGNNPEKVIRYFRDFVKDDCYIWSHSTFDFTIVNSYLKYFDYRLLDHRKSIDIRTIVSLADVDLNRYDWSKKTHNALEDCKFQIDYCRDALNGLNFYGVFDFKGYD